MKKTVAVGPGDAYGLGIASIGVRCGRQWGHGGWILDYITRAYANEKGDRVGVVSIYGRLADRQPDDSALVCPEYRLAASAALAAHRRPPRGRHLRNERRWQRTTAARIRQRPRLVTRRTEDGVRQQGRHLRHERRRQRAAEACARQRSCLVTRRSEDRLPQRWRHLRDEGRRQRASETRVRRRPCLVTGRAEDRVRAWQRQPRRDLPGERRRRRAAKTSRAGRDPAWSPDGRRIAFARKIAFPSGVGGNLEIFVMNADGSGQRRLKREAARGDCSCLVARRAEDHVPEAGSLRRGRPQLGVVRRPRHERGRQRAAEEALRAESRLKIEYPALRALSGRPMGG